MNRTNRYFWLLLIIPAGFMCWYFLSSARAEPVRMLPYYGPGKAYPDSVHQVPAFSFTDQDGKTFTDRDLSDKIYISEFFFTTCQSICPVMNNNLKKAYNAFRNEHSLHFVSHTVDPGTDSVPVLKAYAEAHGVIDERWHFLTGDAVAIYRMARKGYLLDDGAATEDEFVHTQKFALVDPQKKIRGYYDGTDSADMVRMHQEITLLLKEHEFHKK